MTYTTAPIASEELPAAAGTFTITDEAFRAFRELIFKEADISLSDAKRQLVCSPLARRLRYFGFATFFSLETYRQRYPYKDPAEVERFADALRKAGLK